MTDFDYDSVTPPEQCAHFYIQKDYPGKLVDPNNKGSFKTWKEYEKYIRHQLLGRATIHEVQGSPDISAYFKTEYGVEFEENNTVNMGCLEDGFGFNDTMDPIEWINTAGADYIHRCMDTSKFQPYDLVRLCFIDDRHISGLYVVYVSDADMPSFMAVNLELPGDIGKAIQTASRQVTVMSLTDPVEEGYDSLERIGNAIIDYPLGYHSKYSSGSGSGSYGGFLEHYVKLDFKALGIETSEVQTFERLIDRMSDDDDTPLSHINDRDDTVRSLK